ncbi:uncharacterized protein LOC132705539 [Cylas formicarius]|uniref:uncharacterized protein LOC132705539 n=1 Tax=Cylas formicarius TaxID=197179 RepID=UPI0029584B47|nr:uncharacterized protein LOC132705539 [Cylas formicarius]XP_060532165.1 uncharacterized protein LOC132705539 [Cylas formicarius]
MANVFVGFHDNRSCNRILKPPGGGTSNIFGTDRMPDVVPLTLPKLDKASSVQETLQSEVVATTASLDGTAASDTKQQAAEEMVPDVVAATTDNIGSLQIQESRDDSTTTKSTEIDSVVTSSVVTRTVEVKSASKSSTIADVLKQEGVAVEDVDLAKKPKIKSPNRVPPGGYSSGLW